ncbi:MAG TPA: DUF808 domain-containing protein, partial [Arthrobacter sp.]|nr:DUF808 domain-containing protein [Arthrobacter sp.]
HVLEAPFAGIPVFGVFLAWLVNTLCSAVLGLAWGLLVMAIVHPLLKVLPFGKKKGEHEEGDIRAELAGYRPTKRSDDPAS